MNYIASQSNGNKRLGKNLLNCIQLSIDDSVWMFIQRIKTAQIVMSSRAAAVFSII